MGRRVLIVEDEKGISKVLRLFLKSQGYETIIALSGLEAIRMVRKERPDLILLDILLPDINGFEVLGEVRKFSDVPIIVVSANTSAVESALGAGANDALAKPFEPERLLEKIQSVFKNSPVSVGVNTNFTKKAV